MRKAPKIVPYQKNGKTLFKFQAYLGVKYFDWQKGEDYPSRFSFYSRSEKRI